MIDDHGHPFARSGGPLDVSSIGLFIEEGADADQRREASATKRLSAHLMARRLATYLKCDVTQLSEARAEASSNWPSYVRALFADAGIDEFIFDVGAERTSDVADTFAELVDRPVHWIGRIDPVIDALMAIGSDAETIVNEVERFCRECVAAGCVGFKTALAYRTGLAVQANVTVDQAQESLNEEVPLRRRGKACRDLAFQRALGVAAETQHPFQIHTGFGDSSLRLSESNPLLLEDILRSDEGTAAPIVLIHGAYPWTEELGFLALSRPNVYAEVSLFNIFTPLQVSARMIQLLELVSTDRIMFGTDGHEQPESFWFASHVLHESWAQATDVLINAGADPAWVEEARLDVFDRTARTLYLG
jgi:predicted TIM-barrel fold metal-dependent hydrolase